MKDFLMAVSVAVALGGSGQVFGVATTPFVDADQVAPAQVQHFEASID
jgi:hypothetical protein